MNAGADGPVVLHLLLLQAKLYLFILKLELKLFRKGGIWVTFLDVLQRKELVVIYMLTQHCHVQYWVLFLYKALQLYRCIDLIPYVIE